ncbi:MAG: DUF370 domain-containing protein [Eubacteriales bacterium]|jgi:hypothetical protein|nr:DUF370 domain-containing protein [Eubacteriales bacterium]
MYLHIGNNKVLRKSSIIGIFDMDNATVSQITRKFLSGAEKKNMLTAVTGDIPKSFVLTQDGSIYLSQISSSALLGRTAQTEY